MNTTPHIVFIHGMYVNGTSWEQWRSFAEERGHATSAPSWPLLDGSPAELREHLDPAFAEIDFAAVVAHYAAHVASLDAPAVLVGHSMGALVVQKLINEGIGAAGVAIASAPPQGITSFSLHFLRANLPHVNPFKGKSVVPMTAERFHYAFGNTLSRAESDAVFDEFAVPSSTTIPTSSTGKQGHIDFTTEHAPLFFVAAEKDHLIPAKLVHRNAKHYTAGKGRVTAQEFAGRGHLICNEPGWKEVAGSVFDWIDENEF